MIAKAFLWLFRLFVFKIEPQDYELGYTILGQCVFTTFLILSSACLLVIIRCFLVYLDSIFISISCHCDEDLVNAERIPPFPLVHLAAPFPHHATEHKKCCFEAWNCPGLSIKVILSQWSPIFWLCSYFQLRRPALGSHWGCAWEFYPFAHTLRFHPPSCLLVEYLVYERHSRYTTVSEGERHHQAVHHPTSPGHLAWDLQSPHWDSYTSPLIIEKVCVDFLGLELATSHWWAVSYPKNSQHGFFRVMQQSPAWSQRNNGSLRTLHQEH